MVSLIAASSAFRACASAKADLAPLCRLEMSWRSAWISSGLVKERGNTALLGQKLPSLVGCLLAQCRALLATRLA